MKLRKTDKRFDLYRYGFDCYVEFNYEDWNGYNRTTRYCIENLGPEFWHFAGRVYGDGNWRAVSHHQSKRWRSKRIYFRGEKYYTLLLIALPTDDKNSFYL
jgi:hypothetical protein